MQITITSRHGDLESSVRSYMEEKAGKLVHYFERVTLIEVVADLSRDHMTSVEIKVDAEHKHDFVATESDHDLRTAFDKSMHKMEQQIRKYKDKIQDHRGEPRITDVIEEPEPGE